jgi:hypothetical protein
VPVKSGAISSAPAGGHNTQAGAGLAEAPAALVLLPADEAAPPAPPPAVPPEVGPAVVVPVAAVVAVAVGNAGNTTAPRAFMSGPGVTVAAVPAIVVPVVV